MMVLKWHSKAGCALACCTKAYAAGLMWTVAPTCTACTWQYQHYRSSAKAVLQSARVPHALCASPLARWAPRRSPTLQLEGQQGPCMCWLCLTHGRPACVTWWEGGGRQLHGYVLLVPLFLLLSTTLSICSSVRPAAQDVGSVSTMLLRVHHARWVVGHEMSVVHLMGLPQLPVCDDIPVIVDCLPGAGRHAPSHVSLILGVAVRQEIRERCERLCYEVPSFPAHALQRGARPLKRT